MTNGNLDIDNKKIINIQTKQPSETRYASKNYYGFVGKPIPVKSNFNNNPELQKTLEGYKKLLKEYSSSQSSSDIIESEKQTEESIMPQETYTKSEIDLKFEKLNSDVQHGFEKVDMIVDNLRQEMRDGFEKVDIKFDQVNQKLDYSINHILSETRNLLLEQQVKEKAEREQERKATNRWLVGIAISLAGLIISIIVNFFLKK
ncbi:hypothetical protein [Streptococcus suis]|uniref:hypothetical protein n=1 Tax=Streptococcus suis TaxID=1307 RepID=UPI0038B91C02